MSKGYRNGAFALGLVVGGGISLNLFLWLDYLANRKADDPPQTNDQPAHSQIGGYWDGFIRTFVSPSDTLAQWIMAAFTVAVVYLVWKTLVTTQDMARDTQRIGEAQVRAYLSITEVRAVVVENTPDILAFEIEVSIRNSGQSPASDVRVRIEECGGICPDTESGFGMIPANSEIERQRINVRFIRADKREEFIEDGYVSTKFRITLTASDVFGEKIGFCADYFGHSNLTMYSWVTLDQVPYIVVTLPAKS